MLVALEQRVIDDGRRHVGFERHRPLVSGAAVKRSLDHLVQARDKPRLIRPIDRSNEVVATHVCELIS